MNNKPCYLQPTFSQVLVAYFLLAFISAASIAEETQKLIQLRHANYPYLCQAISCFSPDSERQGRIDNQKKLAEEYCSRSWTNAVGANPCEREKEKYAATIQCEKSLCSTAYCKKIQVETGRCVGLAYFR